MSCTHAKLLSQCPLNGSGAALIAGHVQNQKIIWCRFGFRCKLNCTKCFAGIDGSLNSRNVSFLLPCARPVQVKSWFCTSGLGQWCQATPKLTPQATLKLTPS